MLEREDIARMADGVLADFIAQPPSDTSHHIVRITSSTSGREPILSIYSHKDYPRRMEDWYLNASRRLVCYGSMFIRYCDVYMQTQNPRTDVQTLPLDSRHLSPAVTPILADFRPECVMGFPSFIMSVAPYFDAATAAAVNVIGCMGELLTPETADMLRKYFPNASIRMLYTNAEIGPVSKTTCGNLPFNQYHPREGAEVAILEPDATGAGDLLISADVLGRIAIRDYHIGDMARMHEGECVCGATTTFELLGRRGFDYIKLGPALLIKAEFDRVAGLFRGLIDDYRAEASEVLDGGSHIGRLAVRVSTRGQLPSAALQQEIAERFARELFLTADHTLADLVTAGKFEPLHMAWQTDPFPYERKAVKLKRV